MLSCPLVESDAITKINNNKKKPTLTSDNDSLVDLLHSCLLKKFNWQSSRAASQRTNNNDVTWSSCPTPPLPSVPFKRNSGVVSATEIVLTWRLKPCVECSSRTGFCTKCSRAFSKHQNQCPPTTLPLPRTRGMLYSFMSHTLNRKKTPPPSGSFCASLNQLDVE